MCRRFVQLALALILLLMPMRAFATEGGTRIDTEVPAAHTIALNIGEGGRAMVGEAEYTGSVRLEVARGGSLALRIVPDEGWVVDQVLLDGVDVSGRLKDDVLTIAEVLKDRSLHVSFRQSFPAPTPVPTPTPSGGGGPSGGGSSVAKASVGSLGRTGDSTYAMIENALAVSSVALVCLLLAYAVREQKS